MSRLVACRVCRTESLVEILDLGEQKLSDFKSDLSIPQSYPLRLVICDSCGLAQLDHTVSRNLMYHEGYGYKSGVNELIVQNLREIVEIGKSIHPSSKSWLDIASNDGSLLSMVGSGYRRVGVDPVAKFEKESSLYADRIVADFFSDKAVDAEKFDVITSVSMFYDLDDPVEFARQVEAVLAPSGVWIIQQNYLGAMYKNRSFDNVCHEHLTYFSLTALQKVLKQAGLEVTFVEEKSINGGSILTVVERAGAKVDNSVTELLSREEYQQLASPQGAEDFAHGVERVISELSQLLEKAEANGQTVMIYGASTRGAVIWQALGDSISVVSAAVERQQEKIGKFYSAIGIPIISEKEMRSLQPDILLVGPWFLKQVFLEREANYIQSGGTLVFPLPSVEQITQTD